MNGARRAVAAATSVMSWTVSGGAALLAAGVSGVGPARAQGSALAASSAHGSSAAADAAEADAEAQDEILVTAHKQYGAVATDIAPEATINSTAIRALGAADLDEVLTDLAPEIGAGETMPDTASGPQATQGSLSQRAIPVVLVNGQRIAGFASIRDFPPEAVRRVEIFPAQVALQYGYPAGQRVVNVVLRTDYRALTLLGRYVAQPDDWRGTYRAKIDLLRIGEASHWNLDLDYRHIDPIFAHDAPAGPPGAAGGDADVPARTYRAQTDDLALSAAVNRPIGQVSAELTGRLDLSAVQSRLALTGEDGAVLEQEGRPDLVNGPMYRSDETASAQTSLTLNGKLDAWRWSFIGRLDDATRDVRTDATTDRRGLATVLLPSPTLLGRGCETTVAVDCVSTRTRDASGDLYLNGDLFRLPAGPVTAALQSGFAFSGIHADTPLMQQETGRNRREGGAQANLDLPLASQRSAVGRLSIGINGKVRRYSDFGTLSTLGSTLNWSPIEPVQLLASYSREDQAPNLFQLDEGELSTPDTREFDFVNGDTAIVRRIEGGNADLVAQRSRVATVRLQVSPLRAANLQLSTEYTIDRAHDPIASVTAVTRATMAAFPELFTRDADGDLTAQDVNPVNLARRDQQQLRSGINYSTSFGAPRPTGKTTPTGAPKAPARDQFQIALYDTWRIQDDVLLQNGVPKLDLLHGDLISDRGGTPAHRVELQTSVSTGAVSASINADWQSPTHARSGEFAQERLRFSQGVTLDLRLQINLVDQRWLTRRLPFLRGNLNLSADNLLGAHMRVRQSGGDVPLAYTRSYLNLTGRTFRITLRKRFR